MADLRSYELNHVMGRNSDPSDREGTSIARKWIPVNPGGLQMEGSPEILDIPTEHGGKGIKYSVMNRRNAQQGTLTIPLFPELAGTLMLAPGTHPSVLASGLPPYHQIISFWGTNLGVTESGNSAADIGQEKRGVIFDGFSLNVDRDGGGVLEWQLTGFINQDKRVPAVSTTSADTETSGASKTLTLASAAGLSVGDYVQIVDDAAGTLDATYITAISGDDITVANLSDNVDGSGTAIEITRIIDPKTAATEPTLDPYPASNCFIDVDIDKAGWTGDNVDVSSISLQYQGNSTPKTFRPSANPDLNQTWTRVIDGIPTLTGEIKLILAQDEYPNFKRSAEIRKLALRIMAYSPEASGSTTTSNSESASTSPVTVEVAATTGFAVNDFVIFVDAVNNKQCVAKVTTVNAGVSLVVDHLDVDIAAGSSVYNTAWEIEVKDADVTAAPIAPDGDNYVCNVSFGARIDTGETNLVTISAYDDDNT